MKVVFVTSKITYVPDNYQTLVETVCNPSNLPSGVEPIHVLFLKVSVFYVARNILGLLAIGAPFVSLALLRNLVKSELNDPRKRFLDRLGVPFRDASGINDPETLTFLRGLKPDLIVNMRTRNIYRKPVLEIPSLGCLNIHHGLLPENRGTMCDLWAWSKKEPVGFTIHWMNEKIDDGHIVAKKEIPVKLVKRYTEIPLLSSREEGQVLISALKKIRDDPKYFVQTNFCEKKNFTKNPNPSQIYEIRRRGLQL